MSCIEVVVGVLTTNGLGKSNILFVMTFLMTQQSLHSLINLLSAPLYTHSISQLASNIWLILISGLQIFATRLYACMCVCMYFMYSCM